MGSVLNKVSNDPKYKIHFISKHDTKTKKSSKDKDDNYSHKTKNVQIWILGFVAQKGVALKKMYQDKTEDAKAKGQCINWKTGHNKTYLNTDCIFHTITVVSCITITGQLCFESAETDF